MKLILFLIFLTASAKPLEILHWWTSGSEAKAITVLKNHFEKNGHKWQDSPVAGAKSAMTVLKTRVFGGNPPDAAQLKGPRIKEYAQENLLLSIETLAKKENWDKKIPSVIAKIVQHKGKYVGVPVNVHRGNLMWVNLNIFKKLKIKIPKTWDDFFRVAPIIKKAGYIPLALGGEKWQESALFEVIVLSIGVDFYKKLFIEVDQKAFQSTQMKQAIGIFYKLKEFTDENSPGRSWDLTTNLISEGKAAIQIMGDWAKGEFSIRNKKRGVDFDCLPAPGTQNSFTFVVDSFVIMRNKENKLNSAQTRLVQAMMDPKVSVEFNKVKGSIPAMRNLPSQSFDSCSRKSIRDFSSSDDQGTLLPSFAFGMTMESGMSGNLSDVLSAYFYSNGDQKSIMQNLKSIKQW